MLSDFFLFTGKLSALRYVAQVLSKILQKRKANRSTIKDRKDELFDMDLVYGTSFDNWMSQVDRTRSSINN